MKKRLFALGLAFSLTLGLTPALAAGVDEKFPATKPYSEYSDVAAGDWFYDSAKLCYEVGLMSGTGAGFAPHQVMTVGEVAAIAARMNEAITGEKIILGTPKPGETIPWYQWHVTYLEERGITVPDPTKSATRGEFLALLSPILTDEMLTPINNITTLPDSSDSDVLRFYNGGILTGTDKWGSVQPEKTLTRAEASAMVARVTREDLRQSFVPADYAPFTAAGCTPSALFFSANGSAVTAGQYLPYVVALIDKLEGECATQGMEFNWLNTYGEQTFLEYVRGSALTQFGVTAKEGTALYKTFDVQVFYSKLIDLRA